MNHCYNFVSMFFTITKCRCFIEIKRLFSKMAWRAAIRLAKKGDTRNQTLTEISRVCDRIFLVYLEARVLFCSDQNNALSFRVRALFRELQMSSGKPDWIIFFRIESIDSRANLKKKILFVTTYINWNSVNLILSIREKIFQSGQKRIKHSLFQGFFKMFYS